MNYSQLQCLLCQTPVLHREGPVLIVICGTPDCPGRVCTRCMSAWAAMPLKEKRYQSVTCTCGVSDIRFPLPAGARRSVADMRAAEAEAARVYWPRMIMVALCLLIAFVFTVLLLVTLAAVARSEEVLARARPLETGAAMKWAENQLYAPGSTVFWGRPLSRLYHCVGGGGPEAACTGSPGTCPVYGPVDSPIYGPCEWKLMPVPSVAVEEGEEDRDVKR